LLKSETGCICLIELLVLDKIVFVQEKTLKTSSV